VTLMDAAPLEGKLRDASGKRGTIALTKELAEAAHLH
jgi:hypothetical protein